MATNFIKRKEDFVCEHCGNSVSGDGYTNHCDKCLYSKHVDENPGDRKSKCGGIMEPIGKDQKHREFVILHRCEKCGEEKNNKFQKGDSFETLAAL